MSASKHLTLCILGCGNLGTAILTNLLADKSDPSRTQFTNFIACVRSEKSEQRLRQQFSQQKLIVHRNNNVAAAQDSDVVILGADPADVGSVLQDPELRKALQHKLLISVVAGWTKQDIETALYGSPTDSGSQQERAFVLRTLPNIASSVAQGITTIELNQPTLPDEHLQTADSIFRSIGQTVQVPPRLMNAATAVGGSTPAFFTIICDALIDASVAVGIPRDVAQTMIYQAMAGTAAMLQSGIHPGVLRDQGTSPEGCTIAGVMVMEEAGVRGHLGRALREAVTVARLMGSVEHPNDTRQ